VATPIAAASNVAMNVLAIRWWGLEGAAITSVASYVVLAVLLERPSRAVALVPWHWRTTAVAWAAAGGAAAVALLLPVTGAPILVLRGVLTLGALAYLVGVGRHLLAQERTTLAEPATPTELPIS
jgi:O-antigen/teichoic acid export membrane protein